MGGGDGLFCMEKESELRTVGSLSGDEVFSGIFSS